MLQRTDLGATVCHGGEGMVAGAGSVWSHDIYSQNAKQDGCWCSACVLFIQSGMSAPGRVSSHRP